MSADKPLQNQRCSEYDSPDVTDASAAVTGECVSFSSTAFWILAWLGTIAAGGVFGVLEGGGVAGLFVGPILAGVVGIPIHITMATMTWLLWLSRFSVAMSGIAGALTGTAATLLIWEPFLPLSLYPSIVLASLIGGLGSAFGSGLYRARYTQRPASHKLPTESRCQFSLRDLFVRVAIVAGLMCGWIWLCGSIYSARQPVSEETLRSTFRQYGAEFNRLALMFGQDIEFHTIYRDGSYDDKIIDHERGAEYLASLSRAHLSNSMVFSSFDEDAHRIEIRPADALRYRDGCVVGYVYSTIAPTRLVDSL